MIPRAAPCSRTSPRNGTPGHRVNTNPNPKVRKSGAVGKAVLVSMVLAGPIRAARGTRGLRRRNGEFSSEVFYFGVVKAGLSTEVRFCAILAVFLLFCYLLSPRTPEYSEKQRSLSSWIRGMRSSRCWVLGGNFGGNQHADEAKNGVGSDAILRTTDITAFFCFLFILVEVPHARMRKVSGLCF